MTFKEICEKLGIAEYSEAIFNSNSRGDLFHLMDYAKWADIIPDDNSNFRKCFLWALDWSKKNSKNPSAMFQHIDDAILMAAGNLGIKSELLIDRKKLLDYKIKTAEEFIGMLPEKMRTKDRVDALEKLKEEYASL